MFSITNSYCHWCLCRHCSGVKCRRYKIPKYRCINCHYKTRVLECDFFTHKQIKHYKVKRVAERGFTKLQMETLLLLVERLLAQEVEK